MKVKETIKNKYEECKKKISNMDDFTKGLIFGTIAGMVGIAMSQTINNITIEKGVYAGYAMGVENTLNSIGELAKKDITKK